MSRPEKARTPRYFIVLLYLVIVPTAFAVTVRITCHGVGKYDVALVIGIVQALIKAMKR